MKKSTTNDVQFVAYREHFDLRTCVFVDNRGYKYFANNLESFITMFDKMSEDYLTNENIDLFESLFEEAAKFHNYPVEQSQEVKVQCVKTMLDAGNFTYSTLNK